MPALVLSIHVHFLCYLEYSSSGPTRDFNCKLPHTSVFGGACGSGKAKEVLSGACALHFVDLAHR